IRQAAEANDEVILLECLTLWINNLLYRAEQEGGELDDAAMERYCDELHQAIKEFSGTTIMVLNEVGLGIVPENKLARRFRDLSGRCGQSIGAWVDEIYLTVCGRQLKIK
ncbi:MAG: bifunctional adenosylcobinamide kinase/adenosylcobinamide-phosphate guanylyltransferase, partial [Victivallaceae bacterium]